MLSFRSIVLCSNNRANSCILYLNGVYHVDLIRMNGAELPIVELNGAERCVKVNQSGTTDERERNANGPTHERELNGPGPVHWLL